MNLTLLIKLQPTTDQAQTLLHTMERVNAACNTIAVTAFRAHTANKIRLQKLVYADIRATFGLSAQMTVPNGIKRCNRRFAHTGPSCTIHESCRGKDWIGYRS